MLKPICVSCEVEYRPKRNGTPVIEMFSDPPRPYKIWNADTWRCPSCGHEIVKGYSLKPIAIHFEEGFEEMYRQVMGQDPIFCYEGVT